MTHSNSIAMGCIVLKLFPPRGAGGKTQKQDDHFSKKIVSHSCWIKKFFQQKKRKLLVGDLWNGNVLQGNDKLVYVIAFLEKGTHSFSFAVHGAPFLDYLTVYHIENQKIEYKNLRAGARDRTPWITFLFRESVALSSFSVTAKAEKQKRDDEDISILIDGAVIKNEGKKAHRDWYWCGKILNGKAKTFQKDFSENNTPMRIDFAADEGPVIEKLSLNFFHHDPHRLRGTVALHTTIKVRLKRKKNSLRRIMPVNDLFPQKEN